MKPSDFTPGDRVLYVPNHADGDPAHPDCERGIVSSIGVIYVFVRYFRKDGTLPEASGIATAPEDLLIDLTDQPVGVTE